MISRLFSYQFHETNRIAKPVLAISTCIILINSLLSIVKIPFVSKVLNFLSMMALIASPLLIIIITVQNDYQNTQGKRAYFYRSIPAGIGAQFWSRFFYYFVFHLLVTLFSGLQILIFTAGQANLSGFAQLGLFLKEKFQTLGQILGSETGAFFLSVTLISLISTSLLFMSAITIGSEAKYHHLGLGGPVVIGLVFYLINQAASIIGLILLPLSIRIPENPNSFDFRIIRESMVPQIREAIRTSNGNAVNLVGLGIIPMYLLVILVMGILTYQSTDKKISLR